MSDTAIDLGPCCSCRQAGPTVRNLIMLPVRAPVPGTGWGCVVCGLPSDGAVAVQCDACLRTSAPIVDVCFGYPGAGERVARVQVREPFDHKDIPH